MHELRTSQSTTLDSRPANSFSPPKPRKQRAVLIVNDDAKMTDALEIYLEGNDYSVTTAQRAVDGLRQVIETDFDAILCDMMMPRMPGNMFFLAVSKVKPNMCRRFVFIAGRTAEPGVAAFLAATPQPVLAKHGGLHELLPVLTRLIERPSAQLDLHAGHPAMNRVAL